MKRALWRACGCVLNLNVYLQEQKHYQDVTYKDAYYSKGVMEIISVSKLKKKKDLKAI